MCYFSVRFVKNYRQKRRADKGGLECDWEKGGFDNVDILVTSFIKGGSIAYCVQNRVF